MELKQLNRLWGPAKWKTTHLVTPIGTYFNEQNIQIIFELTPKCQDTKLTHMSTLLESGFMADVTNLLRCSWNTNQVNCSKTVAFQV